MQRILKQEKRFKIIGKGIIDNHFPSEVPEDIIYFDSLFTSEEDCQKNCK